jgi:uncharacterized protein YjiS (DUF1127 family)
MSRMPMHNRFVEGFVEARSWGDTIDALSSRIEPGRPFLDGDALRREADAARAAAIAAAAVTVFGALRRWGLGLARTVRERFAAWQERRNAVAELAALDDRTLAELGLHRAEIPFVVAQPVAARDRRTARFASRRTAHHNDDHQHAA